MERIKRGTLIAFRNNKREENTFGIVVDIDKNDERLPFLVGYQDPKNVDYIRTWVGHGDIIVVLGTVVTTELGEEYLEM